MSDADLGWSNFEAAAAGALSSVLLRPGESVLQSQVGVGLYEGRRRSEERDEGSVHLTTERLVYVDGRRPKSRSCALELQHIRQTEFWAGFLKKSSPKITLELGRRPRDGASPAPPAPEGARSWSCRVCGFSNDSSKRACAVCGVQWTSTSVVPSRAATPPSSETSGAASDAATMACPACTFLNHVSLSFCEMCESPLGRADDELSAPASGRQTPIQASVTADTVRLSFRKGGGQAFYSALKAALLAKGWDRRVGASAGEGGSQAAGSQRATPAGVGTDRARRIWLPRHRD